MKNTPEERAEFALFLKTIFENHIESPVYLEALRMLAHDAAHRHDFDDYDYGDTETIIKDYLSQAQKRLRR